MTERTEWSKAPSWGGGVSSVSSVTGGSGCYTETMVLNTPSYMSYTFPQVSVSHLPTLYLPGP